MSSSPETRDVDNDASTQDRPYYTKRPHRKSRAGCKSCKARKVKCDEARPTCRHCYLRKEPCIYPAAPPPPPLPKPKAGHDLERGLLLTPEMVLWKEPAPVRRAVDAFDMRLLWTYTTFTWTSLRRNRSEEMPDLDDVLKIRVVQYAFQTPFLMDLLLGLAAQHLEAVSGNEDPQSPGNGTSGFIRRVLRDEPSDELVALLGSPGGLPEDVPAPMVLSYRLRAVEAYRKAVINPRPEDLPALLAGSLVICALSAEPLRDDRTKPLYILDWMNMWRGISVIMGLLEHHGLRVTSLAPLFYRPPVDHEASAAYVPNNLLFMVASLKQGDPDYPHVHAYYDTLKCLGSLYRELAEDGIGGLLTIRTIVWLTFPLPEFVELAKERRPRALVILAYYLVFTKLVREVWWMLDICDREVRNIWRFVGEEWHGLLKVAYEATRLRDRAEIAQMLLNNHI